MTSISSMSLTSPLLQSIMQSESSLQSVQSESVSGVLSDSGLSLGAQTGTLLSLRSETDRLTTITNANSFTTSRLATTSTALDSMISGAQGISADLITASSSGGITSSLQTSAQGALQTMIAALNSSNGGQYVFGGINTGTAPISNYFSTPTSNAKTAVDSAFASTLSSTGSTQSTISGSDMTTFLNGLDSQFTGSDWQANWSSASSQTIQSTISPSQTMTTSVSANQTAFQQMAEAYTILGEFTGSDTSSAGSEAAVTKATSLINSALGSLTTIQADVGLAQTAVTNANTNMTSQISVLETNVGDLDNVDQAALSTKLSQLETQLQASYELTSKLQSLSILNYLTTG